MTQHTHETFERSMLSGLRHEDADAVETAVMLGWTLLIGDTGVGIVSPNGVKRFNFNSKKRRTNDPKQVRRAIIRYADPERLKIADQIVNAAAGSDWHRLLQAYLDTTATISDHREEIAAELSAEEQRAQERQERREAERETLATARTVVSIKPMLAKRRQGQAYDSPTTNERLWSDGSKDYLCRWEGCDFGSEDRRSVSRHYGGAHMRGSHVEQPASFKAEVPDHVPYRPRTYRVNALADVIAGMMESGNFTPEDIALAALTWVHEQSSSGSELAAEREPMTPEETLQRIRTLLDDGATSERVQQIADLERAVVEAQGVAVAADQRAQEAEEAATRARAALKKFSDRLVEDLAEIEEEAG